MLSTHVFGEALKDAGFSFYSGVPCSFLKYLINYAINTCDYVMANNEGDAVATCAGAYLGGRKSVFLCQNSGLTNATSPLVSLNYPFRIPVLGIVSLRGEEGIGDQPQHELMGRITGQFLTDMEIPWEYLSTDEEEAKAQVLRANEHIENKQSFFFVVKKNTLDEVKLAPQNMRTIQCETLVQKSKEDQLPSRWDALHCFNELSSNEVALLATTGYTGRELYELEDQKNQLYMVGSMGCVSALGLGLALTQPQRPVIAIDGDGALLMRMGLMATNAYYHPPNLLHVLLDNSRHESTGGQATVSGNIDFVSLAASMQYQKSLYCHDLDELREQIQQWLKEPVLTFIHLRTGPGVKKGLGRPKVKPYEVKERFMGFLGTSL